MLSRFENNSYGFHLKLSDEDLAESESLSPREVKNLFDIEKFSLDNMPI